MWNMQQKQSLKDETDYFVFAIVQFAIIHFIIIHFIIIDFIIIPLNWIQFKKELAKPIVVLSIFLRVGGGKVICNIKVK